MQKREMWRSARLPMAAGLLAGGSLFLTPLLFLGGGPEPPAAVLPPSPAPVVESAPPVHTPDPGADGARAVRVLWSDGTVEVQTMADYLWSVTAAEMPASFELDALRAQAVCARTYALWQMGHGKHEGADVCTDSRCCQAYITRQDAAERWGPLAEEYAAKIAGAVADTAGMAALYNGRPIQAAFFSSAAEGMTEAAEAVWGNALPYLTSVDSPEGEEVPNYRSTVTLTDDEVRALVAAAHPDADLSGDAGGWLSNFTYTAAGRVATVDVGGVTLSGGAARNLFGLRSACFAVEHGADGFTFSVTGYGHGVGLSQYGANAMAKAGAGWEEIVKHYYTGVTVGAGW